MQLIQGVFTVINRLLFYSSHTDRDGDAVAEVDGLRFLAVCCVFVVIVQLTLGCSHDIYVSHSTGC